MMPDREKVIRALEMHASGICNVLTTNGKEYCPYWENTDNCMVQLLKDALELLKAQEPVKPIFDELDVSGACGNCGHALTYQKMFGENVLFEEQYKYCPECGRKVLWDAAD